ncbi:MAG: acyltransferase [Colwellia sp.]
MNSRDAIPFIIFQLYAKIGQYISTVLMSIRFLWWNVSFRKGNKFFGLTRINKHVYSTISIGEYCSFRSSQHSNSIGLKQGCFLSTSKNAEIVIGDCCGFSGTVISASKRIVIGNNVICGANTTITDADRHAINAKARKQGDVGKCSTVVIHDDVWLGMNCVILKGVTIGKGAVVAANSLVCKDVPEYTIVGGNPAKVIKELL